MFIFFPDYGSGVYCYCMDANDGIGHTTPTPTLNSLQGESVKSRGGGGVAMAVFVVYCMLDMSHITV